MLPETRTQHRLWLLVGRLLNATSALDCGGFLPIGNCREVWRANIKCGCRFRLDRASAFGDDLNQPAEMKAGIACAVTDSNHADRRLQIDPVGQRFRLQRFQLEDQTIAAVGGKYTATGYWLGLGYNNANDPIGELAGGVYRNTPSISSTTCSSPPS